MSLNLYRQYAARAPWNSKARRQWLDLAMTQELQDATLAGLPFTLVDHKPYILEAQRAGRDWYAIPHY